jgi:hypothetical protein
MIEYRNRSLAYRCRYPYPRFDRPIALSRGVLRGLLQDRMPRHRPHRPRARHRPPRPPRGLFGFLRSCLCARLLSCRVPRETPPCSSLRLSALFPEHFVSYGSFMPMQGGRSGTGLSRLGKRAFCSVVAEPIGGTARTPSSTDFTSRYTGPQPRAWSWGLLARPLPPGVFSL